MKISSLLVGTLVVLAMISSIRFLDDNDFASNEIIVHTNIDNRIGDSTIRGARAKVILLDDGVRMPSIQGNVNGGDVSSRVMTTDFYGYPITPGEYWIRLYVYGEDGERHIRHRPIIIQ